MLSKSTLLDLVCKRFDESAMLDAFLDEIDDRIDYEELADAIASEHECEISEIISELAEDALV